MISIKVPGDLLDELPAPGNGRSRFILDAIAEKAARRRKAQWTPASKRGKRLAALLAKGRPERGMLLSESEVAKELARRRGRQF
jgi:hypothetical protein